MERKGLGLLCGLSLAAAQGMAAPQYASIEVGEGLFMTPALDVQLEYDDNIFQSERNEKDSLVTRVAPAVEWEARQERGRVAFGYAGNYAFFANSSDDNVDNHAFRADAEYQGSRSSLGLYGTFAMASDPRGTGPSDGLGDAFALEVFDKPTEFDEWGWGIDAGFEPGARLGLTLGYGFLDKEYQNFREFTRERDRSTDSYSLGLSYALTGKTSAVMNLSRSDIEYDFTPAGAAALDSKQDRITAGLKWEATARTTGNVQFGWEEKDFDDPSRDKADGFTWEAGIDWSPRTYSTFSLSTMNTFTETDNVGSAKEVSSVGVGWRHSWNDRLSTNVGLDYSEEDFEDFDRADDFYSFSLAFDYAFQRWMALSGGVKISSRDSNQTAADFDRNIVFVRAMMSL